MLQIYRELSLIDGTAPEFDSVGEGYRFTQLAGELTCATLMSGHVRGLGVARRLSCVP